MLLGPLLDNLDTALTARKIPIAHLKAIVTSPTGFIKAAICGNGQEPIVEGDLNASPAGKLELLLNLRAVGEPAQVRAIVEAELHKLGSGLTHSAIDCFSPAAPSPGTAYSQGRLKGLLTEGILGLRPRKAMKTPWVHQLLPVEAWPSPLSSRELVTL